MDANKLSLLREIEYKINPSCGLCKFAEIMPNQEWGVCARNKYQHQKHTGDARQMSITRYGSCEEFSENFRKTETLGKFNEFATFFGAKK